MTDEGLTPDEQQRLMDCVNGCLGIGNPLALRDLLVALMNLAEAWGTGQVIGREDPEALQLIAAVMKLELDDPSKSSDN